MAPKKATTSTIYIVTHHTEIDGAYATSEAANARLAELSDGEPEVKELKLTGGSIVVDAPEKVVKAKAVKVEAAEEGGEAADKVKAKPKAKAKAKNAVENGEEVEEGEEKTAMKKVGAKKTKTVAEQRADNGEKKGKDAYADLPDNVNELLGKMGDALNGKAIVVTGVPPTLGRKNAERLVMNYGGKLAKSISKNTTFVVVGNEAGPKKLEQISDLGLQTYDEDEFIELLEAGGSGTKRAPAEDQDEKPAKAKKAKK